MSSNRFAVEAIMDENHLKHFVREEDGEPSWILLFEQGVVLVRLIENGEFLFVRSLPVAKLSRLSVSKQSCLLRNLLKRNNELKLGHYSADNDVCFEVALPIEDGNLTNKQFGRCLAVVSSELAYFACNVEALCQDQAEGDALDQLMQRLFHGDDSNSSITASMEHDQSTDSIHHESTSKSHDQLGGVISVDPPNEYRVVLKSFNEDKAEVVKIVKQLTGKSLSESSRLVESVPTIIGCWASLQEAENALQKLIQAGAHAEIA